MRDFITSWIGIFGPGWGPVQLTPSSGVIMTAGAVVTGLFAEFQLADWHVESKTYIYWFITNITLNSLFISYIVANG